MQEPQLFNFENDLKEQKNLALAEPARMKKMQETLASILKSPTRKGYKK